jgi:hypothetical protein
MSEAGGYVFVSNMPGVMIAMEGASRKSISVATMHVRNKVVQNLMGTRTGRTYKVPRVNRYYRASAPGEYPASGARLGDLVGSVHYKISNDTGIVFTNLLHGAYLEDPKNTRTEAEGRRRWLKRTFDEEEKAVKTILSKRWF